MGIKYEAKPLGKNTQLLALLNKDKRHKEVGKALTEAYRGDYRAQAGIKKEALSTSDFPAVFQNIINAQTQAKFTELPLLWPSVATTYEVQGFGKETFYDINADVTNLLAENGGHRTSYNSLPRVPELSPYPEVGFTESETDMWTAKYGARINFSWEAFLSDKWGQIQALPLKLSALAAMTTEQNVWELLFSRTTGFNAGIDWQMLANNPVLTLTNLEAAVAKAKADPTPSSGDGTTNGRSNTINKFALLVPPGLTGTAEGILSATQIKKTDADGTEYMTTPSFGASIEIVEVRWMSQLMGGAGYAATSWALVPFAGIGSDRSTLVSVGMRGHASPELRIKTDTGSALGGGVLSPYAGNFDNDSIQTRIRHINNAVSVDTSLGFVASKGTAAA